MSTEHGEARHLPERPTDCDRNRAESPIIGCAKIVIPMWHAYLSSLDLYIACCSIWEQ
jgi:hypothetical protein